MSSNTTNLNLLKEDPTVDGALTFNIKTMLNDNWDKIDAGVIANLLIAEGYTDTKIAAIINAAPGTLDTLNELATALGDDPNYSTTILNALALKAKQSDLDITNGNVTLNTNNLTSHLADNVTQFALRPVMTTAPITYYVATTGNDTTGDGTSGLPFKTIQYAINKLPQIINHTVTINVATGTYNETLTISGFSGKGFIALNGGTTSANSVSYLVNNIVVLQNSCLINIIGFKAITITNVGIFIDTCAYVRVGLNDVSGAGAYAGVQVRRSFTYVVGNNISNRSQAIVADVGAIVSSDTNTGSGNTVGLVVSLAGTIGKNSTQPAGTTSESATTGGVIR